MKATSSTAPSSLSTPPSAASPWHQAALKELDEHWVSINGDDFEGACEKPYIMLAEPKTPGVLGDYSKVSGWGGRGQIRIRESLVKGKHKMVRDGDEFKEGRMRLVKDVLLHLSVCQYCDEMMHHEEISYKGNGPVFTAECNRIGEALGLPAVGIAKKDRRPLGVESCADWPWKVRDPDYYLGAYVEPKPKVPKQKPVDDEQGLTVPLPVHDGQEALGVLRSHLEPLVLEIVANGLDDYRSDSTTFNLDPLKMVEILRERFDPKTIVYMVEILKQWAQWELMSETEREEWRAAATAREEAQARAGGARPKKKGGWPKGKPRKPKDLAIGGVQSTGTQIVYPRGCEPPTVSAGGDDPAPESLPVETNVSASGDKDDGMASTYVNTHMGVSKYVDIVMGMPTDDVWRDTKEIARMFGNAKVREIERLLHEAKRGAPGRVRALRGRAAGLSLAGDQPLMSGS